MYSIKEATGEVIRDYDLKVVSPCQSEFDVDFIEYNKWANAGNNPVPDGIPYKMSDISSIFELVITSYMNDVAKRKGYQSILSLSIRAAFPNSPFYNDGVLGGTWMDKCWEYCYAQLAEVNSGRRQIPSIEEFIKELPPAPW